MERLNQEYIELLNGDGAASDKFWELEKRIRADRSAPGVRLELKKSDVGWDLIRLLLDGVITVRDLDGFSEDLRDTVIHLAETRNNLYGE